MNTEQMQPWEWSEEHWRSLVGQVRAGRRLHPATWKDGARCAVALSFDSDHETSELRDGGRSIGRMAWGQYGTRAGIPRILEALRQNGVKATFFVPAVSALLHPEEQRQVIGEGHEIGLHGWIHELNSKLPYEVERDLLFRSADMIEKVSGVRASGLRTPSWDFSPNTLKIEKELGLLYDSSLMADDDCYELNEGSDPSGITEIPVEWIRDDAVYFGMDRFAGLRPYTPPEAVYNIFQHEFDRAYEEHGLFQLTMHPFVIGYRSRIWILEKLISYIKGKGDCWFARHDEVAKWVTENS
ncbi:polysaccharide deacetylase [Phyllobacterium sp. YR531]|uniref:polysaccharide deacetylase family protein n=1 Tax=Phyllobacterium sp. YR531 TaxID=1144343 RepID=UPI00026FB1ED|nr:polysaccharide deacetylase [Phyllobacterium sp. YR531]EJN05822.1 putative xylanase/chitin deacetylase [Phyllobacterium sp. YR531]